MWGSEDAAGANSTCMCVLLVGFMKRCRYCEDEQRTKKVDDSGIKRPYFVF